MIVCIISYSWGPSYIFPDHLLPHPSPAYTNLAAMEGNNRPRIIPATGISQGRILANNAMADTWLGLICMNEPTPDHYQMFAEPYVQTASPAGRDMLFTFQISASQGHKGRFIIKAFWMGYPSWRNSLNCIWGCAVLFFSLSLGCTSWERREFCGLVWAVMPAFLLCTEHMKALTLLIRKRVSLAQSFQGGLREYQRWWQVGKNSYCCHQGRNS